jgi:hypothetical protein
MTADERLAFALQAGGQGFEFHPLLQLFRNNGSHLPTREVFFSHLRYFPHINSALIIILDARPIP